MFLGPVLGSSHPGSTSGGGPLFSGASTEPPVCQAGTVFKVLRWCFPSHGVAP